MPIQKTAAVVLRRVDFRETSVLVTFYTKGFGKIKGLLRGVRSSRGQMAGGALEPFSLDHVVFYERRTGDIYTVSQCDLIDYFPAIRSSLEKMSFAFYIVELLDSVANVGDKNEDIFSLVTDSLKLMSDGASPRRVARIFEIRLLNHLGLMPAVSFCASCGGVPGEGCRFSLKSGGLLCKKCLDHDRASFSILPGTVKFIEHVISSPFDMVPRVKVSAVVGMELETILRKFVDYQIGKRLLSAEFIKKLGRS